ncbi:MAG TPA: beta-1-3, beta-1-6-glucan biosynthesis protein [Pseudolabrys sp.]|jgi:hypothetical protein|nr:beta-1-3, beta-1-6-glucan biosynthesis protein [Pseudolabrys sp.]
MTSGSRTRLSLIASALLAAALLPAAGFAQSGPGKGQPPQKPAADAKQNGQKHIDELAEAAKVLPGAAGHAECVWLGRRIVILLWRDDIDTALRHLSVYDRFKCPGPHVQAAFRCLIKQGPVDPKATETLNNRAFACWLHPEQTSPPAAAAATPAAATPAPANSSAPKAR